MDVVSGRDHAGVFRFVGRLLHEGPLTELRATTGSNTLVDKFRTFLQPTFAASH